MFIDSVFIVGWVVDNVWNSLFMCLNVVVWCDVLGYGVGMVIRLCRCRVGVVLIVVVSVGIVLGV